jgi:gliding motility-associated-like protein
VLVSGGTPAYTYVWSPLGGNGATATGLPAGIHTCTVSDADGCSVVVEVVIVEPAELVLAVSDDLDLCAGESALLTATASGGTPDYAYQWTPEGPLVQPAQTTAVTVVVTDANGCVSAPATTVVSVATAEVPTFTWDPGEGCAPLCVNFFDASNIPGERQWTFGDGSTAGDLGTVEHCYADGGVFSVTLSILQPGGCDASFTAPNAIVVWARPEAAFTVTPAVALIDSPTFGFSPLGADAVEQTWYFGDAAESSSTQSTPSFTYSDVGCYSVTLEVWNGSGCSNSTSREVCVEDAFALYAPNCFSPNGDGINDGFGVYTTVADPAFFDLLIYDRWGRVIHANASPYLLWDGANVPQGVYHWQVRLRDSQGKSQERQGHVVLIR